MSFTDEVITIAPNYQVITFRDLRYAKLILLEKYHKRIISEPMELAEKYTPEELQHIAMKIIGTIDNNNVVIIKRTTNKYRLAEFMWPFLVAKGRLTTKLAFHKGTVNPKYATFDAYYSDYVPGKDAIRDINYGKLARQAQVIVDMIVEKVVPVGKVGVPSFIFLKWINEAPIETRQGNEKIWNYYKKMLQVAGFIEIFKQGKK